MDEELKQNLQRKSTWMRALYMVLFAFIFGVVEIILSAVVVFQFVMSLLTGNTNAQLVKLGQSLGTYLYQITLFLTFNSDDYPYPFNAWPEGEPVTTVSGTKSAGTKPNKKNPAAKKKTRKTTKKSATAEETSAEQDKPEDETA